MSIITKTALGTYAGSSFIGGGFIAGVMGMMQASQSMIPPPDMNFIQHIDFYSKGYSTLGTIGAVLCGVGFFYFRHKETKRHNLKMEKKNDT